MVDERFVNDDEELLEDNIFDLNGYVEEDHDLVNSISKMDDTDLISIGMTDENGKELYEDDGETPIVLEIPRSDFLAVLDQTYKSGSSVSEVLVNIIMDSMNIDFSDDEDSPLYEEDHDLAEFDEKDTDLNKRI